MSWKEGIVDERETPDVDIQNCRKKSSFKGVVCIIEDPNGLKSLSEAKGRYKSAW
jgi:hypothetical protein